MAESFDFLELFLRDEAAGHAALGFGDKAFAIFLGRLVRNPGRVVTLVARPFDVAAVDVHVDLIFALDGIAVPPTKRDTHAGSQTDCGVGLQGGTLRNGELKCACDHRCPG